MGDAKVNCYKTKQMNKQKSVLLLLLLTAQVTTYCQSSTDTATLIKQFNKVMSFTAQQYLHYTTITKLSANPVLQPQDTTTINGEFFKNNTEIYSNNGSEEMYMQDSLLVQINNDRKTIWLSKVDVSSKEKMNVAPVGSKEMQSILRRDFLISQSVINSNTNKVNFETRRPKEGAKTAIAMEYNPVTSLPKNILITVSLQQPVDEETLASLKEQQIDDKKLLQEIDGTKYLVRNQQMSITYTAIDSDKEKLAQMPLYNSFIEYNGTTKEFTAIGKYKDYEITRMF